MKEKYMKMALKLAEKGIGKVNPNPLVGAIIVKEGKIIGRGFHEGYGKPHGEINAIKNCKEKLEGATLYVTLEPCSHYGKTPPCTKAILESGIKKVCVGVLDPNPVVSGRGVEIMRNNGIEVEVGILEEECRKQNEIFFHYIQENTPFVIMKYAMTLDGKIATKTGESKWITSEHARERVHLERNRLMGIMVGVNTVITDNPMLDCRVKGGKNPVRIICDTNLRTPIDSRIIKTSMKIRTFLATCCNDEKKIKKYKQEGVEVLQIGEEKGHVDLRELMKRLVDEGIDSVLLEGGGTLNYSALSQGVVNKIQTYIAPKLFGGRDSKTPVEGEGFAKIRDCAILTNQEIIKIGEDILIESEVNNRCLQES